MQERPLILVTNDDGITAPGIRALIQIMNTIGDVVVVAPDSPQSGMGHAITVDNVLRCNPISIDDGPQLEYTCSGTPADCVKMAVSEILNRKPDLCVSGINHGANSSINVIYSGTMSAAVEAGMSQVNWPDGKHNKIPSEAIDVAPWPLDWNNLDRFYMFAGLVLGIANGMNISVISGLDWDNDGETTDQNLIDGPHFELKYLI